MRKSLLSLLLLFLSVGIAWAQKKQVSVTGLILASENNEPIDGASVLCVEFPRSGVLTDAKGRFTLTLQGRASMLALTALPTLGYSKEASAFSAASALYAEGVARRLAEDPQLRSWAKEVLAGSDSVSTGSSYGKLLGRDSLLAKSPWATTHTDERE